MVEREFEQLDLPYVAVLNDDADPQDVALKRIERIGRVSYASENLINGPESAERFLRARLYKDHHDVLLEHYSVSFIAWCDRGVADEMARHRLLSPVIRSTRYCNFSKDKFGSKLTYVDPQFKHPESENDWKEFCNMSQKIYMRLIERGETPEKARSVLGLSILTEMGMTANLREWRHILSLRLDKAAHPQMRQVATLILSWFKHNMPIFVEDFELDEEDLKVFENREKEREMFLKGDN